MKNEIDLLKQSIIKYSENYLNEFGEFYPFGFIIDKQDAIKPFDTYFGQEYPSSIDVINNLERAYKTQIGINKNEFKIISICSDVIVTPPHQHDKINALEIRMNYQPNESVNFYIPYKKDANDKLFFLEGYSEAGTLSIITNKNLEKSIDLNQEVFTSTYILKDRLPILYVVHEDNNEWQFLGGQEVEEKDIMSASIQNIIDYDETVKGILHLPLGSEAMRKDKISEWRIVTQN